MSIQKDFKFDGNLPSSKSMLNRLLIIQSYFPEFRIIGDANCDDVRNMKEALMFNSASNDFQTEAVGSIYCGEAGTVLRFIALRVSRINKHWILKGTPRLMQRPREDLEQCLKQLNVKFEIKDNLFQIYGNSWNSHGKVVRVKCENSSQFASALLLNAWNLESALEFTLDGELVSKGYWDMTVSLVKKLGMVLEKKNNVYLVPSGQKIKLFEYEAELDLSSAFVVAAAAVICGHAIIKNYNHNSLQPDKAFVEILQMMGAEISIRATQLEIKKTLNLKSVQVNLNTCPDLFPVLAVLCAFADGKSILHGAPQLKFKESDRILKTNELLKAMGVNSKILTDGLEINGLGANPILREFVFDPDQDHRMAMAAAILKLKGYSIKIKNPQVVDKSFPEFWQIIGVDP